MNIKTKLSLQFTLLVVGILLFFSFLIYYFSYTSRSARFRDNLLVQAQNTAILLINVEEVDSTLLRKIQNTTRLLEQQEIVITNSSDRILYSYRQSELKNSVLKRYNYNIDPLFFTLGEKDGVSYRHIAKGEVYHVFVLAYDGYRSENLLELRKILLWSILFSIWLCISASYFFSRVAMKPISKIISDIKNINSAKLSNRLAEGKGKDEIEQLAVTFNQMLEKLEQVFRSQDEFVANASHELRTPLAVMIAESDYMLSRKHNTEELVTYISGIKNDLRKLNQLVTGLLELAYLENGNNVKLTELRVDELLLNAIHQSKTKFPERKIKPEFYYSENESDLMIHGNSGLLMTVFLNLIENACKFSSSDVEVRLTHSTEDLTVFIIDQGIGIPEAEIDQVLKPFARGSNAKHIGGSGIGLSIVAKIMELHYARLKIKSEQGKGTTIDLIFKKVVS